MKAHALRLAVVDFKEWLRSQVKHVELDQQPSLAEVQTKLREFLADAQVTELFE